MSEANNKTKEQPAIQLIMLRKRIAELEASDTRLKQAEKRLQVSEGRYRSLVDDVLDSSQVGIIVLDAEFKIVWVNQSLECYFGLRRDEVLGKDMRRLIRERLRYIFEDPQIFMEKALAVIRNNAQTGRFECHVLANNNREEWWLEHWAQPIQAGLYAGGVVEYYTDITERKKAEEALRESEEFNSSLLENSPNPIHVLNPDTSIRYVNPALERLTGFSKYEVTGKKAPYPWWQKERLQESIETLKRISDEREVTKREKALQKKSGELFWVELTSIGIRDNGKVKFLLTNWVDVTERKKAEETLRQSEEKLRLMFESVIDGIAVSDLNGIMVECNEHMCKLLGLGSRDEVLGKSWLNFVSPGEQEKTATDTSIIIADGMQKSKEYTMLRADNSEFSAEVNVGVLKDAFGKPAGYIALVTDITERKRMQEQLIVTNRLASIGELASGVAHELNNPLTTVIGFSQLLMEKDIPDDIKADLKLINGEAQRTANVVKNLLTFARKHASVKQPVDIHSIIDKVLELRAYEQKVTNIRVVKQFADLPEIMADYFQLQQVFLNIIVNAEYFMIEAHNRGTLTITTKKVGDMVRIVFADDGPGMSEEVRQHLFSPFFTTKPVGKGTGLGLSICHGIVTAHGGRIYAESVLGTGAKFIMELPVGGN